MHTAKNGAYSSEAAETQPTEQQTARQALERVLASAGFSRNARQSQFLRFLIERHLDGRDSELKESVIAVEVFGRPPDYDPKLDAIVRTEAMRLRARLSKYYADDGSRDPVIIDLPKGGYRPVFRPRAVGQEDGHARYVRMWWAAGALAAVALAAVGAFWGSAPPSRVAFTVAVLPLENLSADPATDYFADGLTDEIIRSLSIIDGLTVRSRTSSFALKGRRLSASEAGKQLGAEYLIEGSVLHAGDQLRVNAQLVRVGDDSPLWSGRFDRELTDIFAIQDEISRGIVNSLRLSVSSGRRRYETNLEAYEFYLRGRHAMEGFPAVGRPVGKNAIQYFEQAIAKDANYALAYAGIADAFLAIDENVAAPDAYPRAKAAAARAIELDPMLSEAQKAWASVRAREHAWPDAERAFRLAIELDPNNALAHLGLGMSVLVLQGRFDEGLAGVRHAVTLDPLSPYTSTELARALLLAGRPEEAIVQAGTAIALDPGRNRPHVLMARALYLQGNAAEALAVFQDERRIAPPRGPSWLACALTRAGRQEEALAFLKRDLALPPNANSSRLRAETYACVGDKERALEHMEAAVAEGAPGLAEILQAPELAWMRPDPRFAALRQAVNLIP